MRKLDLGTKNIGVLLDLEDIRTPLGGDDGQRRRRPTAPSSRRRPLLRRPRRPGERARHCTAASRAPRSPITLARRIYFPPLFISPRRLLSFVPLQLSPCYLSPRSAMSAYQSVNPLWDFSLPPESLTSLPDDDFLAIIQSQIANPTLSGDPTAFFIPQTAPHQDIPLSANPKSFTRIHQPSNVSPPSDPSPSPPSAQEGIPSRRDPRRRSTAEDDLKRKTFRGDEDDGDDGEEPPSQRANPAERGYFLSPNRLIHLSHFWEYSRQGLQEENRKFGCR